MASGFAWERDELIKSVVQRRVGAVFGIGEYCTNLGCIAQLYAA
jgi:hypothetical protein